MITCPDCKGQRTMNALVQQAGGCRMMTLPCIRCKGSGEIPFAMLRWMVEGYSLRVDRLHRDLTQREEAARLGVSVVVLSQMENGIVDPDGGPQ